MELHLLNNSELLEILSILIVVVVVRTHWGIAGTIVQTTYYLMMSFLICLDY